ncbi:MAG: hypothetical protein AAF228_08760, partial [Pseudomonadota bacterium]
RALANETYDDMIESYFPIYGSNIAEQLALAVMDQLGSDDNVKRLAMADLTLATIDKYDAMYGEEDDDA